jgi:hypothetical protein
MWQEFGPGYRGWHENGVLHRIGGPAVEFSDGSVEWCQHGKVHRDDGPASEYPDGSCFWHWQGDSCTFEEWCELAGVSDEEKVKLKLKYG